MCNENEHKYVLASIFEKTTDMVQKYDHWNRTTHYVSKKAAFICKKCGNVKEVDMEEK